MVNTTLSTKMLFLFYHQRFILFSMYFTPSCIPPVLLQAEERSLTGFHSVLLNKGGGTKGLIYVFLCLGLLVYLRSSQWLKYNGTFSKTRKNNREPELSSSPSQVRKFLIIVPRRQILGNHTAGNKWFCLDTTQTTVSYSVLQRWHL